MKPRTRSLCLTAALAAACAAPSSARALTVTDSGPGVHAKAQYASYPHALAATGDNAWLGSASFSASLVVPSGVVQATEPQNAQDADLRRTWASLEEWAPRAPGVEAKPGDSIYYMIVDCQGPSTNPTTYDEGVPGDGAGTRTGIYFDVRCADGGRYDFYRVHFDQRPGWGGLNDDAIGDQAGRVSTPGGAVEFLSSGWEQATMTVCGFDGAFDCSDPSESFATIWPLTSADQATNSDGTHITWDQGTSIG